MDVQFVFGNPVKGKKHKKKKGKRSMAKKKSKSRRPARNKKGQFVKRSSAAKRRRRNPDLIRWKSKSGRVLKAKAYASGQDRSFLLPKIEAVEKKLAYLSRKSELTDVFKGSKAGKRAVVRAIGKNTKRKKKADTALARLNALIQKHTEMRKKMEAAGYTVAKESYRKPKLSLSGRSKAVAKKGKKKGKKKAVKKAKTKVVYIKGKTRLASLLSKATPKHPVRGRYKRKGQVARIRLSRSKYRKARNPMFGGGMIQSYLAHSASEAGGLLLGGALYGTVGSLLGKIPVVGPQLVSTLRKVPVVGPSLPTLLAGVALVKLGERQGIDALRMVGKGLIGATVVGIGVNASSMIPGLGAAGAPKLAGVDYTALDGVDFTALGADVDGADFGSLGHDGQMGEQAYGELPEGLSGVDFTMGDGADFGELPAGLGEGQMG